MAYTGRDTTAEKHLKIDGKGVPIQAPNLPQTYDATLPNPVRSPIAAVPISPVQTITIPQNAITLIMRGNAAWWWSESALVGADGYKIQDALRDIPIPVAGLDLLYVRAAAGTVDLDFMFEMI